MRTPNFFIIGAPKCGTTAMHAYLRQHPQVYLPENKEPHFFCTDFPGYRRVTTDADYRALFEKCQPQHQAVGEASVFYLYSAEAVANLRAYSGNAKIIIMLRNPVEMAYALHSQLLYSFREDEADFEQAWRLQEARARGERLPALCRAPEHLQYGRVAAFAEQLERVFALCPRDCVQVLLHEEFTHNPRAAYRQILDFLEVDDDGRTDFPPVNANKQHRCPRLAHFMMHPPFPLGLMKAALKRALRCDGTDWMTQTYWRMSATRRRPRLSETFRRELVDFFRDDVNRLEQLLGRDLSQWQKA